VFIRGDHFRFGSVFIKKSNQTEIFFFEKKPKPNRNRVKPAGFGSVFLGQKPVQTDLARFFRFWLGFFRFSSVFPVWLGFGSVFPDWLGLARFFSGFLLVSVRFGFLFIKPKPNRTGRFFKKINRFNRFFF
jgi:hypothetical protein